MRSYSNKGTGLGLLFIGILVLAGAVAVGVFFNVFSANDPTVAQPEPTNATTSLVPTPQAGVDLPLDALEGEWTMTRNGTTFTGLVHNGEITIDLASGDTSMLYWYGTFSTAETNGAIIGSNAIEIQKPVMSQAVSKTFKYEGGKLIFEFEAMGRSTKVALERRA